MTQLKAWLNILYLVCIGLATISFALSIVWLIYYMVVVLMGVQFMTGTMISVAVTILLISILLISLFLFYLIRITTYARGLEKGRTDTHGKFIVALEQQVEAAVQRPGKLNADYWDGYADACSDLSKTIESGK